MLEPLCNLIRRLYIDKDKKFPFFNFWNGSLARTILWWILWTFLECLRDLSPNHRLFKHIEARSGWVCSWMFWSHWPMTQSLVKNLWKCSSKWACLISNCQWDGTVQWKVNSSGHLFSKWVNSSGHFQNLSSSGHFGWP